jgi:PAS domain-containing protein
MTGAEERIDAMHGPTAAVKLDAAGRYVDANQTALELLGVPSVEVLRETKPDTFSPRPPDLEEQAAFMEAYIASAAKGLLVESALRRTDGELIRARTAILPEGDGYRVVFHPLERPTENLSVRVYTISDVLAEWRQAERKLVDVEPGSDEAIRVNEQIELFKTQYQRMFHRTAGRDPS